MIEPAAAMKCAEESLRRVATAAPAGVRPVAPLFVTRLDEPRQDYYLVPFEDDRGVVAVVQVAASTGVAMAAATFPQPQARLVMTPHDARRTVEERLATTVIGEPRLVWRPVREAASALAPLYQVQTAEGDAFVAADGSVFRTLSPFGSGG